MVLGELIVLASRHPGFVRLIASYNNGMPTYRGLMFTIEQAVGHLRESG
jgi:hypothetical protein